MRPPSMGRMCCHSVGSGPKMAGCLADPAAACRLPNGVPIPKGSCFTNHSAPHHH
jgi:hypothetical protein